MQLSSVFQSELQSDKSIERKFICHYFDHLNISKKKKKAKNVLVPGR